MFRKICRYVLPRRVRSHVDIFSFMREDDSLRKNDLSLFGNRVLVLSPHPDDDAIGCGGTLHLLSKKGIFLRSICMTDGRKGDVGRYSENDLVRTRYHEAKCAAEIIGIEDMVFFNERDGELKLSKHLVNRMLDEIHKFGPSSILFPSVIDAHPDHTATTHIIFKAISSMKGELPLCIQYEVSNSGRSRPRTTTAIQTALRRFFWQPPVRSISSSGRLSTDSGSNSYPL
jgi:LmbE family N-acetylglucosaminyl deacetylase